MYPHKSGWQKQKERVAREARQNKGQQTLFQVGLLGPNTIRQNNLASVRGPTWALYRLERFLLEALRFSTALKSFLLYAFFSHFLISGS